MTGREFVEAMTKLIKDRNEMDDPYRTEDLEVDVLATGIYSVPQYPQPKPEVRNLFKEGLGENHE